MRKKKLSDNIKTQNWQIKNPRKLKEDIQYFTIIMDWRFLRIWLTRMGESDNVKAFRLITIYFLKGYKWHVTSTEIYKENRKSSPTLQHPYTLKSLMEKINKLLRLK